MRVFLEEIINIWFSRLSEKNRPHQSGSIIQSIKILNGEKKEKDKFSVSLLEVGYSFVPGSETPSSGAFRVQCLLYQLLWILSLQSQTELYHQLFCFFAHRVWDFSASIIMLANSYNTSHTQAYLRGIMDSVPDHHNKANIAIKQVTQIVWFLSAHKSAVCTIL